MVLIYPVSIIVHTTSLERRPIFLAICGGVECVALAFGPLPNLVFNHGATGLVQAVLAQFRDRVLGAYKGALVDVFNIALGLACLALVSTLGIEWKSVKKGKNQ